MVHLPVLPKFLQPALYKCQPGSTPRHNRHGAAETSATRFTASLGYVTLLFAPFLRVKPGTRKKWPRNCYLLAREASWHVLEIIVSYPDAGRRLLSFGPCQIQRGPSRSGGPRSQPRNEIRE